MTGRSNPRIDKFIEKNSDLITDTLLLNFVINEKARKYEEYKNQNIIKEGEKAPNFYLENIYGEQFNLSDFKGKVVYVNFWGTYCVPCINSIPEKNKIVKYYENDNFILVNICLDSNYSLWKKIISDNDFKGVHLICKGNWKEILTTKYNIQGVPHYSLISKEGLIIKNGIRDSIEYYIDSNL